MCIGLQQQKINGERDRLNIKAFYIRLSHIYNNKKNSLPDYLTLHYLPRINGSPLQIDGSDIRSDSPAFVTLHRVLSSRDVIYGSRERVITSSGSRFEVYLKDDKVIKGIFRKGEFKEWKMECKCALERGLENLMKEAEAEAEAEAEVLIESEGMMKLSEKVDMVVTMKGKGRFKYCYRGCLEEIPEEESENEVEGCCCCCSECVATAAADGGGDGGEGGEEEEEETAGNVDLELEGMKKKVEVAFWMVCVGVGVGLFVSKASSRTFHKRIFF